VGVVKAGLCELFDGVICTLFFFSAIVGVEVADMSGKEVYHFKANLNPPRRLFYISIFSSTQFLLNFRFKIPLTYYFLISAGAFLTIFIFSFRTD
jgi:hypothetical protein